MVYMQVITDRKSYNPPEAVEPVAIDKLMKGTKKSPGSKKLEFSRGLKQGTNTSIIHYLVSLFGPQLSR